MDTRNVNKSNGSAQPLTSPLLQPTTSAAVDKAKQAQKAAIGSEPKASDPAASSVNVELSPAARQLSEARRKATEIARNTPDVREDRVAMLKAQIDSGTYKPEPGRIADGMLREAILERLSESKDV